MLIPTLAVCPAGTLKMTSKVGVAHIIVSRCCVSLLLIPTLAVCPAGTLKMTSKVGVAHKISRALTRAVYLAPPYSQSWIRPCSAPLLNIPGSATASWAPVLTFFWLRHCSRRKMTENSSTDVFVGNVYNYIVRGCYPSLIAGITVPGRGMSYGSHNRSGRIS